MLLLSAEHFGQELRGFLQPLAVQTVDDDRQLREDDRHEQRELGVAWGHRTGREACALAAIGWARLSKAACGKGCGVVPGAHRQATQ
jgi:hypothetical protein